MRKRRILVIGNSHSQMLLQALREREDDSIARAPVDYRIAWLRTEKYGDTSLETAEAEVSSLRENDLLVMARLGAQHNKMSLFSHEPYRLYDERIGDLFGPEEAEVIPQSVIKDALKKMVEKDRVVSRLKSRAVCHTVHFPPPPPKEMAGKEGTIVKAAVSGSSVFMRFEHPVKRLCIWRLEQSVTNGYLTKIGVQTCSVPDVAVDKRGFLLPEYSAPDLTHANSKYGHLLLRHFEDIIASI